MSALSEGSCDTRSRPRQPFAAGQHAVGAIVVDEAADEGAERAVRGGFGDQAEDDAAGIISALLAPLLGARHAAAGAEPDAIVDRLLQLAAPS